MTVNPDFQPGDRVKLWGKSTDIGVVEEAFRDEAGNRAVIVVWERNGCSSEVLAYQLQYAGDAR